MDESIKTMFANPSFESVATIAIAIAAVWVVIKLVQKYLLQRIKDNDHQFKAKKLGGFVGAVLTILIVAVAYRDQLSGLTVAFGVAGAGIAFALQEVIASFAGWLAIMFGGFYKAGDRVQLGGIKGDVMDVGVLRTTLMETGQWVDGDLYNGRIVLIANSFVFKEPVFNYSGDFPFLWDEIKIPIQYGSDYEKTKEILELIAQEVVGDLTEKSKEKWTSLQQKYRLEKAQTEPMVSLVANDNWVEYTLRYVVSYKNRRATKTALFTKILRAIEDTHGEIKFASQTISLVEAPEIKIKMQ
ncbi:MAG: mechanosensitive ion channel family protein [Formosimonas sp.]